MGCHASTKSKSHKPHVAEKSHQQPVSHSVKSKTPAAFVKVNKGSLQEDYEISRVLGEGAFGRVELAYHRPSKQERALKTINVTKSSNHSEVLAEIEIMKALDHPNIVRVFETFEQSNSITLAMELCSGGELFDRILDKKSLSENEVAHYMLDLISAMNYMHSIGIVHRDLKPENLLLESPAEGSRIKLVDFGTATRLSPGEKLSTSIGTAYYIAPEVISGCYTEKCDVWSAGVIMFIMLAGAAPFNAQAESEICKKILNEPLAFRQPVWRSITHEAIELIKKMLTKDPRRRPSFAEILYHPWLYERGRSLLPDNPIAKDALLKLGAFNTQSKLARATLLFITAQTLTAEETRELRELFESIDENRDGKLSREELEKGVEQHALNSGIDISKLLKDCDNDGSGFIDYNEFLTAALDWGKTLNRDRLWQAFKAYDIDGDGSISLEEIRRVMGEDGDEHYFMEIINEADKDGDGAIDFNEFSEYITKKLGQQT